LYPLEYPQVYILDDLVDEVVNLLGKVLRDEKDLLGNNFEDRLGNEQTLCG